MNSLITHKSRLPFFPMREAERCGAKMLAALDRLGFVHKNGDGRFFGLRFSHAELWCDDDGRGQIVTFALDHERMWHYSIPEVKASKVLAQLRAVTGYNVWALDQNHGLTFAVELVPPPPKARLPKRVPLDLSQRPAGDYLVPLGLAARGPIWHPLPGLGHSLVAGSTGSGKSSWLQGLLTALTAAHTPDQLRLLLIDPKVVEFSFWRSSPHLMLPVATELPEATTITQELLAEIDRRFQLFARAQVRSWQAYNRKNRHKALPLIVVFVDEFLDLAVQGGTRCEFYKNLVRMANRSRAAGIVYVLSATNPKAEVMNTSLRNACTTRLAFRCNGAEQSRVILEASGAEKLPATIPGRCLARLPGEESLLEMQAFWLPDDKLLQIVKQASTASQSSPALTEGEVALVHYAVEHLGGAFVKNKLVQAFGGQLTDHALKTLAASWEACGWLTPSRKRGDPRRVTAHLAQLAGVQGYTPLGGAG